MMNFLRATWVRLPVILRGSLAAVAILFAGQVPPGVFVVLGMKLTPAVPWFLPATIVWLVLYWSYLNGRGWPAATASQRRENLRGGSLPWNTWLAAGIPGALALLCVLSAALLTARVATLPPEAYAAPLDLTSYPVWTSAAFFLTLALVAGVVEEAAFRGYMLSIIERRHGWVIGIASAAVLFYVVHLSHPYARPAFIPFFAAYSVMHGLLVFMTRSIRPSVVLHVIGDVLILPIQYGVVANPLGSSVVPHVLAVLCFGAGSVVAYALLARVNTIERTRAA
jgi:membrane protease YdiL (CAAX protease family)